MEPESVRRTHGPRCGRELGGGTDGPRPCPSDLPLWRVTVVFAGDPVEPSLVRAALERLVRERPFLSSARYGRDRAELTYWDEAEDLDDAAALALRLWFEHRASAGLPDWRPVALKVLDGDTARSWGERGLVSAGLLPDQVRPL